MTSLATPHRLEAPEHSLEVSAARGLLDREGLLELLDRAVTKRVTVISAPPGSGKTSLLRAWAERWSSSRRIASVSVERDADGPRFWHDVLDAIRIATGAVEAESDASSTTAPDGDDLVERVRLELAEHAGALVLLIDDLHELRAPEAPAQLERLLGTLPRSTRLVLSSRRDPPITLHRLRLADEIAEIRAGDLRFSEDETRQLLLASSVSLSDAGAAALHERTEGWAAGLRLAVIALGGHPDPERFVAEFSGTDRAIGEYLMAEMLERQPSEVQSMLLRTSIVDRVNGDLADLLTNLTGSEQMLLGLEEANAFVVSLDTQRTWFRYHQLLADFLRLELRRTLAGEVRDLHRRAAHWFADRGDVVEAVPHMLAAGDWPDAAQLLADHSFSLTLDGQEGTIDTLLRGFPEGASADHPDLALAHAATEVAHGRLDEAAAQLALAEAHVESTLPARRGRLTVAIASLRLALARRSGHFMEVIEQVNLLDSSILEESRDPIAMSTELHGVALMNLGIVETWSGRLADAERHLSAGESLARAIGRPYLEVACRAHRCFPSKLVSVAAARERGQQAVALAERNGYADRPILAPALGAVAGMAVWMGDFDEAEAWLGRAWAIAQPQLDPAAGVLLHVATGMLHAGRGDHRAALEDFTAAAQTQSRLTGVHALAPRIAGWRASTQARLGMTQEARATLRGYSGAPERMGPIHNALAVILIAESDFASALEALAPIHHTTEGVDAFTLVETDLLAGIAHLRLGDRTAGAAAAEAALASAEPDRLIFPFVMTDAAELLAALPGHLTAHGALLADVIDVLRGGRAADADRDVAIPRSGLSPTELRVLRYLPTNLTRSDIARELYVTVNTVNTHVRNIYSKLGVRDRSSAVQRARELRLPSAGRLGTSRT